MSEWKETEVNKIGTVISGGTPSTTNPKYWNGDILFVTPYDLSRINTAYLDNTERKISKDGLANSSANILPAESIVISSRAPIGYIAIGKADFTTNQGCKSIIPNSGFDSLYLYYCIGHNVERIKRLGAGSTFAEISKGDLEVVKFPHPVDKTEQRQIALILSTCDAVIEKTQAAIAKFKAIKQGMLHDLFSRGIDLATGKLRPKYEDASELYKESKLGMVPREWEVKQLGEIGEFKNGVNKDKASFGHGTLFVNIIDAYPEILDCTNLGKVLVNENEKHDYELIYGDIIFVRSSVKPEGVGYNTLFFNYPEDIVFCGFMIRFRLNDKQNFHPEFYNSYFRFEEFRRRLIASSTVSANTNINQVALSKLLAIKPKKNEQLEIIRRLETIDNKLQSEQNYLKKLQAIKQGLMGDLLSGRKRVKT